MLKRVYFPLVILFWVIMNVLLWRSEMSGRQGSGSRIPVANVWQRILTAPDDSSLQILHQGRKIGFCRWVPSLKETIPSLPPGSEETAIEGLVTSVAGYAIDFDGNVLIDDSPRRLRFAARVEFGTNQVWQKLQLRLTLRPFQWELRADATTERLSFITEENGTRREREFTFADLARPETLLAGLGLPAEYVWLGRLTQGLPFPDPQAVSLGLTWDARSDWLNLGHSRLRVYRVETKWLDKYAARVSVSRVGELLRLDLPDGLALVNEALANLPPAP